MHAFTPLENPGEVDAILSRISIFGGVTEPQKDEIFRRLETGRVEKGQFVFQKGEEASHIYIVERGSIELFIPDRDAAVEKKRLGVGECFGQVALMSIHPHTISAVALENTDLIVFSRRALHGLHHEDIELFSLLVINIARELARRLQYMDEVLLNYVHARGDRPAAPPLSGP